MFFFVGELKSGETVLIHAAGSGVGTAAVQLAKLVKAVIISTAGTKQKLTKAKMLGANHVICYKTEDFAEKVMQFTNGKTFFFFFSLHYYSLNVFKVLSVYKI